MRKFTLVFSVLVFSLLIFTGVSAEDIYISDMQTVVLPRDVFVGDEMEIRCTFSCEEDLLPEDVLSIDIAVDEIPDMTVKSITLQRAGLSYMLSMLCVPWSLGDIEIPPVLLYSGHVEETETESEEDGDVAENINIYLDIPAVTIKSIVNYTGASDLRPSKAPILVPGT